MEKDLEIIREILKSMNITESAIEILLKHLVKNFENSNLGQITPNFLYRVFIFELGRHYAEDVAHYFKQYKETGSFKNKFKDFLDKSPWSK